MKILIIDKNPSRCNSNAFSAPVDHIVLVFTKDSVSIRDDDNKLSATSSSVVEVDLILCHLATSDRDVAAQYDANVLIYYGGGSDGYDGRTPEKGIKIWRKVESGSPVTRHEWGQLLEYTTCIQQGDKDCLLPPCVLSPVPVDQFFALKILIDAFLQARLHAEDKCSPQALKLLKSAEDSIWWRRALRIEKSSDSNKHMTDWGNAWQFNQPQDIVNDWKSVKESIGCLIFDTAAAGQRDVNDLVATIAVYLEKRLKCR